MKPSIKKRLDIIPNSNRSVFDLSLDSVEGTPRYVSNSARDLLRPINTSIYYRDNNACAPGTGSGGTNLVAFLTDQPTEKYTHYCKNSPYNSKEYLSFISELAGKVTANIKVTYASGATTTLNKNSHEIGLEAAIF